MASRECYLCGDVSDLTKVKGPMDKWYCGSKKPGDSKTCLSRAKDIMNKGKK